MGIMENWQKMLEEIFGEVGIKSECENNFVKFELPNGKEIRFAREHSGIADFFVVRIDGKVVHQG